MNPKAQPASAVKVKPGGRVSASPPQVLLPETIVVGVDENGLSDDAVTAGAALAELLHAKLELVHAVRVPIFEWMASDPARGSAAMTRLLETASSRVNARVRTLHVAGTRSGTDASVRACSGPPAAVLLEAARDAGRTWIVLGPHAKRGFVEFGNTARTILAKGIVPAWIQVGPWSPVSRILAPVDLSPDSLRSLTFACVLAKALSATVGAVHLFDSAELFAGSVPDPLGYAPAVSVHEIRDNAKALFDASMSTFDWLGVQHSLEFEDGRAVDGIVERSSSADLVVIGTHGRTGLAAAALGGVARGVLRHSEKPVLAIPYPGRAFRV